MDQQHSAIVKHVIKCFSCLPLSLTCVLSLNDLINDCWMRDHASFRCQLIHISHRILMNLLL